MVILGLFGWLASPLTRALFTQTVFINQNNIFLSQQFSWNNILANSTRLPNKLFILFVYLLKLFYQTLYQDNFSFTCKGIRGAETKKNLLHY